MHGKLDATVVKIDPALVSRTNGAYYCLGFISRTLTLAIRIILNPDSVQAGASKATNKGKTSERPI